MSRLKVYYPTGRNHNDCDSKHVMIMMAIINKVIEVGTSLFLKTFFLQPVQIVLYITLKTHTYSFYDDLIDNLFPIVLQ